MIEQNADFSKSAFFAEASGGYRIIERRFHEKCKKHPIGLIFGEFTLLYVRFQKQRGVFHQFKEKSKKVKN